jgi:hypothetical protein
MIESEFLGLKYKKPRKSRKARKNYTVTVLNPVKAKGRYRKGEGLNKGLRVKGRNPIRGDRLFHNEDAIWLGASTNNTKEG